MYTVYKIYQANKLVYVTYNDIIPQFTDKTKLNVILNSPAIPHTLFEDYYRSPDLFSITTHQTSLPNALVHNSLQMIESYYRIGKVQACAYFF